MASISQSIKGRLRLNYITVTVAIHGGGLSQGQIVRSGIEHFMGFIFRGLSGGSLLALRPTLLSSLHVLSASYIEYACAPFATTIVSWTTIIIFSLKRRRKSWAIGMRQLKGGYA
jgi:hypothetical protein